MNPGSTSQDPISDPATAVAEAMSATEFLRERERGGDLRAVDERKPFLRRQRQRRKPGGRQGVGARVLALSEHARGDDARGIAQDRKSVV